MPKITNEQKMQVIKDFLDENGVPYKENHMSKRCGIALPLMISRHRIAVRIGDSQEFFDKTKGIYYPIFIRDTDTKAKVLEKIQNTIVKSMVNQQNVYNKRKERNASH